MTVQKAIMALKMERDYNAEKFDSEESQKLYKEPFNMAIEALEKQIRQKQKHAYWRPNQFCKDIYYCSECGRHIEDDSQNPYEHFPYCHCGAEMIEVKGGLPDASEDM